jgi:hypothetical protein
MGQTPSLQQFFESEPQPTATAASARMVSFAIEFIGFSMNWGH